MELLDIVDENNQITGRREERNKIHEKSLWHRHASCWIMNSKGEILLQKRSANRPRNPNLWAKTGGHVDAGESVEEALLREVKEEIGVDLSKDRIELLNINKSKEPINKFFVYNYFARVNYLIEDYTLQEEEVSEVRYVTIEDIEKSYENRDPNYVFTKWEKAIFYEQMEMLKERRKQ